MKLTRRLVVNVIAFFIASGFIIVYGVVQFFGSPLDDPDTVSTELSTSAGLRENFSVSHNGIVVGVISGTEITETGVRIDMTLNDGVSIPRNVEAKVVRASPVGEQRLELVAIGDGGGSLLADDDFVPAAADAEPPIVSEVVDEVVDLIEQVPPDALNSLIEEASIALEGRADDIALFIESSTALNDALLSNEAEFRRLLDSAPAALDTLNNVGDELETSLRNSTELSSILADSSPQLISLLRHGSNLGIIGSRIVEDNGANLVCLTADLADLNEFVSEAENIGNLDRAFQLNYGFFGPINNLGPKGPAKDLGLGTPRPDQTYLRVQLLLPSQQPPATPNVPSRSINPVRPGAACTSPLGPGAGAVTQADPGPLFPGGEFQPPGEGDEPVQGLSDDAVVGELAGVSTGAPGSSSGLGLVPLAAAGLLALSALRHVIAARVSDLWSR